MEILEYAIKMETDGEAFYQEQALKRNDNKLHSVFISLAKDEEKHAKIIRDKKKGINSTLDDSNVASMKNVFSDTKGFDFEKSDPKQIDVYKKALKMEQASIDLYKKLLDESKRDKRLFEYLVKQEEAHFRLIEEIIKIVDRPNEWVESAEFGIRDEY